MSGRMGGKRILLYTTDLLHKIPLYRANQIKCLNRSVIIIHTLVLVCYNTYLLLKIPDQQKVFPAKIRAGHLKENPVAEESADHRGDRAIALGLPTF